MSRVRPRFQKFSWPQKLPLIFGSALAGLLLFEAGARILHVDFNLNPNWRYHPVLGWSQVPNSQETYYVDDKPIHVEFNSKGFRDVEHTLQKPAGKHRIVVIGDSMCEAAQVNLNQTFFRLLEQQLSDFDSHRWEVINLGVGDFGTAQEWIALNKYGFAYSPDIVVCEIFPLNDICNNAIDLFELCNSNNDRYRPYFIVRDGQLVLTNAQPFRNWIRRYSITYGIAEWTWLKLIMPHTREKQDELRDRDLGAKGYPVLDPLLYTFVKDSEQLRSISNGWKITELILEKMIQECRKRQITFLPVLVPFEGFVGIQNFKAFTSVIRGPRLIRDYPEERLGRFFNTHQISPLMLQPIFDAAADSVLPYIDGHLNPAGHRIMAEAVFTKLRQQNLIPFQP